MRNDCNEMIKLKFAKSGNRKKCHWQLSIKMIIRFFIDIDSVASAVEGHTHPDTYTHTQTNIHTLVHTHNLALIATSSVFFT